MRANAASSWIARILAVLAVAASAVVIYLVVSGSLDGSDGERRQRADDDRPKREQPSEEKPEQATYTVQSGDTLSAIAIETGVPVEKIEQLNPDLDPQSLTTGQVLKLR